MIVTLNGLTISSDGNGSPVTWKLTDLVNWYSSPPVRADIADLPLADGGFAPARTYRSAKVMSIQGFVYGGTAAQSIQQAWQQIAAVAASGNSMTLTVADDSNDTPYMMTVWLSGNPTVLPFGPNRARFEIPLTAVDPRKYIAQDPIIAAAGGSTTGLVFPLFDSGYLDFGTFAPAGLFYVTNNGTAESWPIFKVRGAIGTGGFSILSASQNLTYGAAVALGAEITLSPYAGGRVTQGTTDLTSNLTTSNWPSILPGQTRLYIFSPIGTADANALLTANFSDAWW